MTDFYEWMETITKQTEKLVNAINEANEVLKEFNKECEELEISVQNSLDTTEQ